MKMNWYSWLLLLILVLGTFLRVWHIDQIPSGIHADEADGGYTAYSLLETGLSPHGTFNPLALDDNNTGGVHAPLYTYSQALFVKFFGLNMFSVRGPSVVYGSLTLILFFLVLRRLFKSENTALLGTFLLAVNPWAIHISRQGLGEAISLFWVMLGATLFLYSEKKLYLMVLSAVAFGLALFSYDAPKIFLPPFIILLIFFTRDTIFKLKSQLFIFGVVITLFYGVMLHTAFTSNGLYHFSRASVFDRIAENVNTERYLTTSPLWLSQVFHNKLTIPLKRFETSYVSIFSLNWLFINGSGNLQQAVGNHGQFFLFELPFFFIGIFLAFKKSIKLGIFLLGWMLLGAVPGGLTTGNYAYRSVHVLPIPIIFSTLGILWFWEKSNNFSSVFKLLAKPSLVVIMLIYTTSYLHTYFFDYPVYASEYWNKQQNEVVRDLISVEKNYKTIYIDGGEPWAITYAYFKQLPPVLYQASYKSSMPFGGDPETIQIGNIVFAHFHLEEVQTPSLVFPKGSLLITDGNKFPQYPTLKTYRDSGNVRVVFKMLEVK